MDLRRLGVLREVGKLGSLSAAARALGYTQPAVSHQIAQLEAETGAALVIRSSRGVQLTDVGRALSAHADEILTRVDAAAEEVAAMSAKRAGRVRLAAFPTASATVVADALSVIAREQYAVDASFVEAEPPEAIAALRAGEVDVAVLFEYAEAPIAPDPALTRIPLFIDELIAVVAADHPSARDEPCRLASLADEVWIAGCERCRLHLLHACDTAGFGPDIRLITDDYVAVQRLVASGIGVSLLPRLALHAAHRPDVAAVRLHPSQPRPVFALVRTGRQSAALTAALEALQVAAAAFAS